MYKIAALVCLGLSAFGQSVRSDDPLEYELAPLTVTGATKRKLSDYYDVIRHTLVTPGDLNRKKNQPKSAQGVNTLGEPLQGAWWVKRHYYEPLSNAELVAGPGTSNPPALEGSWTIVAAKTEGVTPGFVVVDSKGDTYFVKFDPLTNPEMATAADHISIRLLHALGYHVPENYLVEFPDAILSLGDKVKVSDLHGGTRPMTKRDLVELLARVPRTQTGHYRATASLAIKGKGIGPYRYYGVRSDDPNDFIPHEHRRDLRGLAIISAWIDHDDSRAINTYDSLADGFIKHYVLDLGSTLGSGTQKANSPRSGGEYLFGWKQAGLQLASLGGVKQAWSGAYFPPLPAVGRFEYKTFDPEMWVPEYPNPAFLNRLPDDEFWATKQIMAFSDQNISAIVRSAGYTSRDAQEWVIRCLIERRDKIGRAYFAKVLPIDRFAYDGKQIHFEDLAESAGFGGAGPYDVRWLDGESGYRVANITSQSRPGQQVQVTVRTNKSPAIVAIERTWSTKP